LPEHSEIKAVRDACAALSPLNQKRAYEVASALQFAAHPAKPPAEHPAQFPVGGKPATAAGAGFVENGDRRRAMKTGNKG
jgi:hypothetical protein